MLYELIKMPYNFVAAELLKRDILRKCAQNGGYLAIFSLDKPEKNKNYRHFIFNISNDCSGLILETEGSFEGQKERSYMMFFNAACCLSKLVDNLRKAEQNMFILFSKKENTFFFYDIKDNNIAIHSKHHLDSLKVVSHAKDNYTLYVSDSKFLNNIKFCL